MKINVVLFEPEIPQNTGNIVRTIIATNGTLHLIKPFGFSLEDKFVKRASANFIKDCKYFVYENWEQFLTAHKTKQIAFYTRFGKKIYTDFKFNTKKEIYLVFGSESKGINKSILCENIDSCYRLPMSPKMRSLNLANTVMTVVYDCARQDNFQTLSLKEVQYGEDYLEKHCKKQN